MFIKSGREIEKRLGRGLEIKSIVSGFLKRCEQNGLGVYETDVSDIGRHGRIHILFSHGLSWLPMASCWALFYTERDMINGYGVLGCKYNYLICKEKLIAGKVGITPKHSCISDR